jgi:tRNA dimethylallyltransferase
MHKPKVIAVVGPTASGKTSLAVELALALNGEVISADSRQVYRGLDIGSGKVTKEEAKGVPHHLIDVIDPEDTYTAADFARDASEAIKDIVERGKNPIIAGGTFFYLDQLRGLSGVAGVPKDESLRRELEDKSAEELFERLKQLDPNRASVIDRQNRHRLIRSIEIASAIGHVPQATKPGSNYDWLIFGIDIERELLHKRIEGRMHQRLKDGMEQEVSNLLANGLTKERLAQFGLEYRYLVRRHYKELTYEQMTEELFAKIRQFAKRQQTWLKRDKDIIWKKFPINTEEVISEARAFLETVQNQTTSK